MPKTALEHLQQLLDGNARFAKGSAAIQRAELALGQEPFAVVLGCSDSRVPVETVFDRGPGEIFVVRVAGNVVTGETLASVQYAVELLKTPLVLVLGHTGCGAVSAALELVRAPATAFPGEIGSLVEQIVPAARAHANESEDAWPSAVAENVRRSMDALSADPLLAKAVEDRRIAIRGAVYDLHSGSVRVLE